MIVTLPEATPVFEAERLQMDLQRAGINNKWWVVNACLSLTDTQNSFLKAKAAKRISLDQESRTIITGKYSPDRMEKHIMEKKQGIGFFERYLTLWLPLVYYCRNCVGQWLPAYRKP